MQLTIERTKQPKAKPTDESKLGFGIDYNPRGSFGVSAAMYDLNHPKYRLRSDIRLHNNTYGVVQMTRPFGSSNGGTYFGIKQVF